MIPAIRRLIASGTWDTSGGTLNSTGVGSSDIVDFRCNGTNLAGDAEGVNSVYSAKLLNQYGNSGNLVGLLYNAAGRRLLRGGLLTNWRHADEQVIEGERYTVRTATHSSRVIRGSMCR